MTGKHHNFHKRWTVDLVSKTALHESGLLVEFTPKTGVGFVKTSTEQPALDFLSIKNGRGNAGVMLERLKRESAEGVFVGTGWKKRIVQDACEWIESVMGK